MEHVEVKLALKKRGQGLDRLAVRRGNNVLTGQVRNQEYIRTVSEADAEEQPGLSTTGTITCFTCREGLSVSGR